MFAMVGSAGNVILFVCTGVLLVIVAAYTLAYAAHCYLVVVQGTAAGIDKVEWPDEPVIDWLVPTLWLGGLVILWLGLAAMVHRGLGRLGMEDPTGIRGWLLAGAFFWFFFPLSLLSSLGSSSRWIILSPRVLAGLFMHFPSLMGFYLATGTLLGVAGVLVYVGVMTPGLFVLPIAAGLGGAVLLIHGRLVGRLAWLLNRNSEKSKAKPKSAPSSGKKRKRLRQTVTVSDPWAVPPITEQEPTGIPGYRVVETPVEEPKPPISSQLEDPDPYLVADEPPPPPQAAPRPGPVDERQLQRELDLRTRRLPNPPPVSPLVSGVYSFPVYSTSQRACIWLGTWGMVTLFLIRLAVLFWPF